MHKKLIACALALMIFYGTSLHASTQSSDMLTDQQSPLPSERSLPLFSAPPDSEVNSSEKSQDMLRPLQPIPDNASQDMVNPTIHHQPEDRLYNWPQGSLHP